MAKRQSLKHLSPEEKADRKRQQATVRKQRERARKEKPPIGMSPELEEFLDELLKLGLRHAVWGLAQWERENKQKFPELDRPAPDASLDQHQKFESRRKMLGLARFYVGTAIKRDKTNQRHARFLVKEAEQADGRGISVDQLRNEKRLKREASAEQRRRQEALQTLQRVRVAGAASL
ncbi:hypothetical protein FHT98_3123 [Bosea sp. AK1]|uniref:hypothetical protein n=1 Tax=Bosea sp. AK1 TaxID=2587160 RepID=UPI00115437C0|nr:hypothetical protein [Bosea sp. AK1]TQI75342.1 hypothetical protein FHT98_3123 [Bosea sp. AK1]